MKERLIKAGDSINLLCALKIWNRCLETVVASFSIATALPIEFSKFIVTVGNSYLQYISDGDGSTVPRESSLSAAPHRPARTPQH